MYIAQKHCFLINANNGDYMHTTSNTSFYRFGCPNVIISDQGREFVNKVSRHLFAMTHTEHRISSAYHPQTNGLVERFNQTLQRSLVKLVNSNQSDWDEKIDRVLFAYRTAPQKSTKLTPFQLMYCRYYIAAWSPLINHNLFARFCVIHIIMINCMYIFYNYIVINYVLGNLFCQSNMNWVERATQVVSQYRR